MTTELEQDFFSVFGIEQEYQYHVRDMGRSYVGNKQMLIDNKHLFMDKERKRSRRLYVANVNKIYPDITAELLLKMICVLNKYTGYTSLLNDDYAEIKDEILRDVLFAHENLKLHKADLTKQIQQLFDIEEINK